MELRECDVGYIPWEMVCAPLWWGWKAFRGSGAFAHRCGAFRTVDSCSSAVWQGWTSPELSWMDLSIEGPTSSTVVDRTP